MKSRKTIVVLNGLSIFYFAIFDILNGRICQLICQPRKPSEKAENFHLCMMIDTLGYELFLERPTATIYINRQKKRILKCSKPGQLAVQHEIVFLTNLDHPAIIKPISFDMEHGMLELPYMEFGDLFDLLHARGCLSEEETKFIISDLLMALAYLAEKEIAHLDIKSENILIAYNGRPLLFDFGLAEAADTGQTEHGGTTGYVAPEILEASSDVRKADVWSLGVVMYECLYGEHPFYNDNPSTQEDRYEWELQLCLSLCDKDSLARDLLAKMLAFNPNNRISAKEALQHPWLSSV